MEVQPTFIFLNRVITPTASLDSGTGDPIPISWPVSLGSNFGVGLCSLFCNAMVLDSRTDEVVLDKDSGLPPVSARDFR